MIQFYKIAGLTVAMDTYGRTERQARAYLTEPIKEPDIQIISYKNLIKERYPYISDEEAEYLGTGGDFYKELLNYNGFCLHSSAVVYEGKAYLFSADSGTGKSTHTALWLNMLGDQAYIINDDKPALRLIDGIWYAFGTPWSGKDDISVNTSVQIGGICLLERGDINEIKPFQGKDAIFEMFVQTNRPKAGNYRMKLLELLDDVFRHIPVWKMKCNMDIEAAVISCETMSGKKLGGQ